MEIRRLIIDDWVEYQAFRIAAVTESPYVFGSTPRDNKERPDETWRALLEAHRDPHGAAFAALDGQRWVGVMRASVEDGVAWIYSVYVAPDARRSGVATTLLSTLLDWCAKHTSSAMLHVGESNARATRLYERFGFVATGETVPNPAYPTRTETEMQLLFHQ